MKPPYFIKSIIPKWFNSIAFIVFFFVLIRPDRFNNQRDRTHETVHYLQMLELWIIGFYPVYFWLLAKYGYKKHPMEKEAYELEVANIELLKYRIRFGWKRFLGKNI